MLSVVFSQGVFDQYDIPEYEYRTFQLNGNDLFNMTSTGDNSTTSMNVGADYTFESQAPGGNCSYGLNFSFDMFDDGLEEEVSASATDFDIALPFAFDKYLLGGNKGGFGFVDGDFSMMGGDQAEDVDDTMDLNLTLGGGYGRVVNARAVAQAYAIADAVGDTSDGTVLAIAAVIGAAGSYANTYKDDADEMYYNDIANAAGDPGAAMKISKILNSPAYNISDRSTGWSVRAGLTNNYMQCEDCDDAGDFALQADYAMPMGMDKQLSAGFDYGMDMNDDGGTTMGLDVSCTMDHSYNWASSASFGYDSSTSGGDDAVTSSDIVLGVSTTKAVLNQLSVTGSFGYIMPNDGNDDTDDDATMDLNVTFTYWVF
jgi:hypothetical protein